MQIPETRFARTVDGMHIAYQVFGHGPARLVYLPRFVGTIGYMWEIPQYAALLDRLGSIATVVALDVRGSGMSDRNLGSGGSALEARMLDVSAVLDAVRWERASLLGCDDNGALCALFAATHPDRVERLLLFATKACGLWSEEYEWGWTEQQWDAYYREVETSWGDPTFLRGQIEWLAPSNADDAGFSLRMARLYLLGANYETAQGAFDVDRYTDIRDILSSIQAPTVVLHRVDDRVEPVAQARYLAERIAGARLVELPGPDHEIFAGEREVLLAEIEEFLVGTRPANVLSRVLATVLFTDIVDSTARAAELGDERWRDLLSVHDRVARDVVADHGGRYVHTTGDGLLATFDGPARAVRCAQVIGDQLRRSLDVRIRAGVHTGEVERVGNDVQGIAVHIGARVAAMASSDEILVSSTVRDLVAGSGLVFEDADEHHLKGVPEAWRLYRVVG